MWVEAHYVGWVARLEYGDPACPFRSLPGTINELNHCTSYSISISSSFPPLILFAQAFIIPK